MIAQLVEKHFMMRHIGKLHDAIDQEIQLQQKGDQAALDRANKTGITIADLGNAKEHLAQTQANEPQQEDSALCFIPQHAVTSVMQSVLQEHLTNHRSDLLSHTPTVANSQVPFTATVLRSGGNEIVDLFSHFGPHDVGWTTCLVAQALRKLVGRHKFNTGPAPINPISNKARIILLSDWGTGVPRAQDVGASARRSLEEAANQGRDVHVVHLGDVYYAGFKSEYDRQFLRYWPVHKDETNKFASYNLNGNHDMYSGGHDYFDYLLADQRFGRQQQCSFFGLENSYWQILALDTAYEEGKLTEPQADWVADKRNGSRHKAGILLSHHQPFTAFEKAPAPEVLHALQPVIDQNLILGWWWGHEHRCVLYAPQTGIQYPRCIGYGGVPIIADKRPNPPGVNYQYHDFVPGTDPAFARFGFVVMDFDNEKLHVQYLGENGVPHYHEELTADATVSKPAGQV